MGRKPQARMMPSGAVCWEGECGSLIIEAPRATFAGTGTHRVGKYASSSKPAFEDRLPKASPLAGQGEGPGGDYRAAVASPLDWKRRWGLPHDAVVVSSEGAVEASGDDTGTCRGCGGDGRPVSKQPHQSAGAHFRSSLLAVARELYRSRDGRFVIFEDRDGHLTSVDSSRFA